MLIGVLCIYGVLVLLFHDFMQPVTILAALRQAKEKGGVQGAAFRQFELSVTPLPESEGLASRYVVLLRQVAGRQLSS